MACFFAMPSMDKTINNQANNSGPGADPLKQALEKAASIDEIHKGPSGKIPAPTTQGEEETESQATSADDSGE
jgi:hypothetical protein